MLKKVIFKALKQLNIGNITVSEKDFGITVVCFHRISDETDYSYPCMPINTFTALIKHFAQDYSVILPKDIGKPTQKPKLIITFDDGYKDFMLNALPVLVKHNVPAIMNVVVNTVLTGEHFWTQKIALAVNQKLKSGDPLKVVINGIIHAYTITPAKAENIALELFGLLMKLDTIKRDKIIEGISNQIDQEKSIPMMNVADLEICLKNNILIGSHSYTHENLTLILSDQQIQHEIIESKTVLEKLLGIKVEEFAFPNGLKNASLIDTLIEAGYKNVFTTEDCLYTPQPYSKINIIPRIILFGNSSDENILRINLFHARIKNIFTQTVDF